MRDRRIIGTGARVALSRSGNAAVLNGETIYMDGALGINHR